MPLVMAMSEQRHVPHYCLRILSTLQIQQHCSLAQLSIRYGLKSKGLCGAVCHCIGLSNGLASPLHKNSCCLIIWADHAITDSSVQRLGTRALSCFILNLCICLALRLRNWNLTIVQCKAQVVLLGLSPKPCQGRTRNVFECIDSG